MKFTAGSRRQPLEYEKDLIKYWRDNQIFEKSVQQRPAADSYVFYDGPPFITGVPHHGTLLSSVVKDAVPRFFTMKGQRIERVWGWDCHGLPAEVFTEKKLGIKDRRDIGTKISLEEYIRTCRDNMVQTGQAWEETIARIGRWVDFKNAYRTMDKSYMESVWWAFKRLYEAGKLYEGEKVLLYCTRDATPIAKAEVAMDNSYKEVTDPSVYVKFKLRRSDIYLLAWTTTPWTLPANTALAVNQDLEYSQIDLDGQRFILASDLLDKVLTDEKHQPFEYKVEKTMKGKELVGQSYQPLFDDRGPNAHKIWHAPYVTLDEGTGIVHLAPAYGEEDYELAQANHFPIVSVIDDNGFYTEGEWKQQLVWDVDKQIAKQLHERGDVWKIEYIRHSYPHCHRCGTRLMYRAHPSWFMDIANQRQSMLDQNRDINWFPEHFKNGRFAKNIVQAPDWNLSRDRFWATALPVWKAKGQDGKELIKVVGSYAELKELSGVELDDYHRPWVDEVTFEIDGLTYHRVDKVMDSWFEAGAMPFAQFHYPFQNQTKFEQNFPGDFIAEYVGQVRAWFYYLHTLSVGLFDQKSFKNVIVTGTIAGNDGRKMSKSYGNYTDPNELMDRYSADALRFLYLSSPLLNGEDFSLNDKDVSDIARKLGMIWNMYDFFTLYASVDGWQWDGDMTDPYQKLTNPLDQWIVSRVHQLSSEIENHMTNYDIPSALKGVIPFIDDASNWYIRRSRKRFWKSDNDEDKQMAYKTLHYVLVRLSVILAPYTPFLSEELYRKLTAKESVHLEDWPPAGQSNGIVIKKMKQVREVVSQGLAQRAKEKLKVRQPIADIIHPEWLELTPWMEDIIKDELNVKRVSASPSVSPSPSPAPTGSEPETLNIKESDEVRLTENIDVQIDPVITSVLKQEGRARELIRHIQNARKKAGLQVDDRIKLGLRTDSNELNQAIKTHRREIFSEVLATGETTQADYIETIEIDGAGLTLYIAKANSSN